MIKMSYANNIKFAKITFGIVSSLIFVVVFVSLIIRIIAGNEKDDASEGNTTAYELI